MLDELRKAAERGVRVRPLLDDNGIRLDNDLAETRHRRLQDYGFVSSEKSRVAAAARAGSS